MHLYLGTDHKASRSARFLLKFDCERCGHAAAATVIGEGEGSSLSFLGLDNEGARTRSAAEAEQAARKNAEWKVGLRPCPQCREADPKVYRRFMLTATWQVGLHALMVAAWIAFLMMLPPSKLDSFGDYVILLVLLGVTGVACCVPIRTGLAWQRTYLGASEVAFGPLEALDMRAQEAAAMRAAHADSNLPW